MKLKICLRLLCKILLLTSTSLISIKTNAQDNVVLPRHIAERVYVDIKENRLLRSTIVKQDSVISAYERVRKGQEEQIEALKSANTSYNMAITYLEEMDRERERQLRDQAKEHKRKNRIKTFIIIGQGLLILALL